MAFAGSERFAVTGVLGKGGMGDVFEAHDRLRDMPVAVKALRNLDPVALYRFKREFRAVAELAHPNIVALYDLFAEGSDWFFTMELVPGDSFIDHVRAGRRPPREAAGPVQVGALVDVERLRAALVQLAEALVALHDAGLIHRDLKPSNVRITPAGRLVLMDFGIVADRRAATGTVADNALGTPGYMAPEQVAGEPATAAADWYGFGVMTYLALTGQLPYRGSRREVLQAKQERDAPPLGRLVDGVPEDLEQLCMALLARAPEARPDGATVLSALGAPVPARAGRIDAEAVFVGRDRELQLLQAAWERARAQTTSVVFIEGESGMGKSSLVAHFVDQLERGPDPPLVLTGRCHERESLGFKAFDGIIDDLTQYLHRQPPALIASLVPGDADLITRLFPVLRRVRGIHLRSGGLLMPSRELRARAINALRNLLASLADHRPVVLWIDDLHWADHDSLELVVDLFRAPPPMRLLVIGTLRSENLSTDPVLRDAVDGIADRPHAQQLALGPLAPAEQERLIAELVGGAVPLPPGAREPWVDSPLSLVQLARFLVEAPATGQAAPSFEGMLAARVARLPAPARALLEGMAVAGDALPLWVVADTAELDPVEGERAAALLRSSFLARVAAADREPWPVCYHDRIRDLIVAGLDGERRRNLHRRLAGVLERWDRASPGELARHWLGAGEVGRAIGYLDAAGEAAAGKLAFDRAAGLLQAACELEQAHGSDDPAHRPRLLRRLADMLVLSGRGHQAARTYLLAAELADPDQVAELERLAADNLLRSGHLDSGMEVLARVLDRLDAPLPGSRGAAVASVLWRRTRLAVRGLDWLPPAQPPPEAELGRLDTMYAAATALGVIDHVRGAALQMRHLETALSTGDERRALRAQAIEVAYLATGNEKRRRRGDALSARLLARAVELDDPFLIGVVQLTTGGLHFFSGRGAQALAALTDAEQRLTAVAGGADWERVTGRYFAALSQLALGDLAGVAASAARSVADAERRDDLYARTLFRCIPSAIAALREDRAAEAERDLQDALAGWPARAFYVAHYVHMFALTLVDLYQGRGRAALDRVVAARPQVRELMLHRIAWIGSELRSLEARAALLAGDPGRARTAASRISRAGLPFTWGAAGLVEAALAARDDRPAAVKLLEQARADFDSVAAAHMVAACDARLAELDPAQAERAAAAAAWMNAQGVVNPERFLTLLAPGF